MCRPKGKSDLELEISGSTISNSGDGDNKDLNQILILTNADKPKPKSKRSCRKKFKGNKNQRKVIKVSKNLANDSQGDQEHMDFCAHSNSICAVDNSDKPIIFDSFTAKLASHPLATSQAMMTTLNVEGICHLKLEVDTAASHNIISEAKFKDIQKHLHKIGRQQSKQLNKRVKIRLADGSVAPQECPVVQLKVSTDLRHLVDPIMLTFLVVKGPNNLLGRHSLARLWPEAFERFKNSTCENLAISKDILSKVSSVKSATVQSTSSNNSSKSNYKKSKSNIHSNIQN